MIDSLRRLIGLIQQALDKYSRDDGPWLASAMAYYAAFSLFPLVLVLVSLLGVLLRFSPGAQDARSEAIALVARNASPAMAALLSQVLSTVQDQAAVSGPFGLIVLVIAAGGIFAALVGAFDKLWNVPAPTTGGIVAALRLILFQRLTGFLMLLALGALIVATFAAGLVISAVSALTEQVPVARPGWQLAQTLFNVALNIGVFAAIYRVLPKPYVRWRDALAGALFSAIVWEIGRLVLAEVLARQTFSAYGVVGAFIALMAWIYYACSIFFVGAELVQVRYQREQAAAQVPAYPEQAVRGADMTIGVGGVPLHSRTTDSPSARSPERPVSPGEPLRRRERPGGMARIGTAGFFLTLLAGALYATLHTSRHR